VNFHDNVGGGEREVANRLCTATGAGNHTGAS